MWTPTRTRSPTLPADLDAFGRRALAAVVDHALVALLAAGAVVPLALFAGVEASVLTGVGTVVWFGYFMGLEALAGRTVGKRALGLVVVAADGGRPDAAAAAVRTLCRVVDWLPAGYLLGAAVVAVGGDGRRVGDRAAGTRVVRAPVAEDGAPGRSVGADGAA